MAASIGGLSKAGAEGAGCAPAIITWIPALPVQAWAYWAEAAG